ncbi:uncharacterized protein CEXT_734821 [Caerostris extrusa]|uniref:Uncharacterized protein n=1 Tax=Caerostris extrusa TaxID=172846 RepID=A0AAV4MKR6_CAEEX|nr:uncharacterized protein CEXT_734821 [Caerostris extrusa]
MHRVLVYYSVQKNEPSHSSEWDDFIGRENQERKNLMQLPTVRGHQVFQQPEQMKPATHLWWQFRLVELKQNMRHQGDTTFIDVLNALRVGELTSGHFEILDSTDKKSSR